MKKILVTGAGGYIGRHVVQKLIDEGMHVIASDIISSGIPSEAEIITEDIFSGDENIFQKLGSPDVCIHMAWKDGFVHDSKSHIINLSKHFEFIDNMIESGLKQIVVIGTMHEVGYHEGAINENTPCNPTSYYGIAKDCLRRSCFNISRKKDVIMQWVRAYYIYGDDSKNKSVFTKLIEAENKGQEYFPFTTGKNKYDFITVEELSTQISKVALQTKIDGIINCCSGKPISLAEQVENFIKENNLKIKLKYGEFPDREYDSPAVWGDDTKIKEILKEV